MKKNREAIKQKKLAKRKRKDAARERKAQAYRNRPRVRTCGDCRLSLKKDQAHGVNMPRARGATLTTSRVRQYAPNSNVIGCVSLVFQTDFDRIGSAALP